MATKKTPPKAGAHKADASWGHSYTPPKGAGANAGRAGLARVAQRAADSARENMSALRATGNDPEIARAVRVANSNLHADAHAAAAAVRASRAQGAKKKK